MTSAAELFYTRRSRAGRDAPDPATASANRNPIHPHGFQHRHHQHRHGRHEDDAEPLRRGSTFHARHLCHRVSHSDRELLRSENQFGAHIGSSNNPIPEASGSRINIERFTSRNDRLPSTVLMARARLLERLRGVSFTGNRGSSIASGIPWDEFALSDDFRLPDEESGDWESENRREWPEPTGPFDDPSFALDQSFYLLSPGEKKPQGLSSDTIGSLPCKTFHAKDDNNPAEECCICLERFEDGEKLFFLLCGHRFHPMCLDPWVRICGDCPYCRRAIVVNCNAANILSPH